MSDAPPPFEPTPEAREFYGKHREQVWADQQASADALDNNLLKFSSAALGLSIAFVKDIVPLLTAQWIWLLYVSWSAFGACILLTIAGFKVSVEAQKAHLPHLRAFYLEGDTTALSRKSPYDRALPWLSLAGVALLFLGIVSTILFASLNIHHARAAGTTLPPTHPTH